MATHQSLGQLQIQTQKLTPQQLQLIQMLELPLPYLEEKIKTELQDNPALDTDAEAEEKWNSAADSPDNDKSDTNVDPAAEQAIAEELEKMLGDEDDYRAYSPPARSDDVNDRSLGSMLRYQPSIYESLEDQIRSLSLSPIELKAAQHILGLIDDYGFLRKSNEVIRRELSFLYGIQMTEAQIERLIRRLHKIDPPGIATRSLQEALMAQLESRDDWKGHVRDLALTILRKYFKALVRRDYEYLMSALGISSDVLQAVLDMIRRLNPTPLVPSGRYTPTLVPDFIVRRQGDGFSVDLNNGNLPSLRVSPTYLDAYKREIKKPIAQRSKDFDLYKSKIERARHFIDSVRQRQHTMLKIMNAIVRRQRNFFYTGDWKQLRPMVLRDIAEDVGMDISTVSRVTSNKVVDMDYGVIPLKKLFSEGISSEQGVASSIQLKEIIKDIVAEEDKIHPLTDDQIAEQLKAMGYDIARRTVAKYRKQLGIPSSSARREKPFRVQ